MKKRYKILIFIIFLSSIISILHFTGFCFREFKYLNDDEILKNFLDSAFLDKVEYDDNGGLPPRFYIIKENPTNYEILQTLKYILDNDTNKTINSKKYLYNEKVEELTINIESLNVLQTLKKYYTIEEITNKVSLGYVFEKNKYVYKYDIPLKHSFFIIGHESSKNHFRIQLYGKDSFTLTKNNKIIKIVGLSFHNIQNSFIGYIDMGNNFQKIFAHEWIMHFKNKINIFLNNYYDSNFTYNFNGVDPIFLNEEIKVDNCGFIRKK
ncbi:hypothetical protein [Campylobacter ureolyticus]|uniref:Uncharacterized protein n=1 Tax=Campylobacter ureolyticus TaxID=827 RepID=A0AAE7EAB0_9BACT|nr:hypothetical protein [Campylobacter ureolyticus]MCR8685646.1 hypothetical protein [Campylobacter ureolyticus]QKF84531.1 hypothetical protein CURT_1051 [Campylobacter ureolyticus]QQY35310.1 hypothetical protein I6I59_07280 [Campylobacter ureolyticus]SUX22329.1 Uncharacterised protein [Campylobacter ureolyticus]